MALQQVDSSNFREMVSQPGIVMIDCWAEWCGGCKEFDPVFERIAARHPQHAFARLDTQANEELIRLLGVEHIPSLLLYRDGLLLFNQPGSYSETALEDIVRQAESLDMEAVRAEIAAMDQGQRENPRS